MKTPINCRFVLALALCLAACASLHAQGKYDKEKETITKVKRSPEQYVYAEATCTTPEEALAVAQELFYLNVNEYVAEQRKLRKSPDIVVNDSKTLKSEITMPRGSNMHRCFLYVRKKDIIGTKNTLVLSADTKESSDDTEQVAGAGGQLAEGEGQTEETVEVPLVPVFPAAAMQLASLKTVQEVNAALKKMKQDGSIIAFDKYKNITDKAAWFLVLYDAQGNVNAVLSDGEERFNVATGRKDDLANYPKNAALGVKFKE